MAAILGIATYVTSGRSGDEDALTIMLQAARRCLGPRPAPPRLALASMDLPYTRRAQAGMIATGLNLPRRTFCLECTTSARAATEAVAALGTGLVLAAGGNYGAAVLLGEEDSPAHARIEAIQSALSEYPGLEFCLAGTAGIRDIAVPDYAEEAYIDLIRAASEGLEADWLALNPPAPRLGRLAEAALGYREATLAPEGAGAAGPLLALRAALDRAAPGDRVLLTSYGSGSAADALLVRKGGG